MHPLSVVLIAAVSASIAMFCLRRIWWTQSRTMPGWKLLVCLTAGWLVATPAGWLVVRMLPDSLTGRVASALGMITGLIVYVLATSAIVRAAGNRALGFPLVTALGLLQLTAVIAAGLASVYLAYWLFGG